MPVVHCARTPRRRHKRNKNPEFGLAIVTFLIAAFLPPTALILFGLDYATAGGNPLSKVHPATYFAIFGLLALTIAGRGPVYLRLLKEQKGLLFYFLSWLALQLYTVIFQSTPLSATIDTFFLPGMLFLILATLNNKNNAALASLLDIFMALNSVLAIYELVSGFRLIPVTAASAKAGVIFFANDWRPSAFMGHPLTGAVVTGAYFLIVLSHYRMRSNWYRFALLALSGLALLAYGGRMALGTTLFCSMCYLAAHGFILLGREPVRRHVAAALFFGPLVIVLVGIALFEFGFLDKFIQRLNFDNGSAESRSLALELVTNLPMSSLIHGLPQMSTTDITTRYGVATGVESFWLSFMLRYGLIGCVIFFPGLFVFVASLVRQTRPTAWLIILYFFITISTSVSISSKNLSLVFVTIFILANYRKNAPSYQIAEGVISRKVQSWRGPDPKRRMRASRPFGSDAAAPEF